MKKYLLLFGILLSAALSFAEIAGTTIKGILLDESNIPIPYATIILKNSNDSILYKGEITNEKGEFKIDNVSQGSFFLQVQKVGYEKLTKPNIEVTESTPIVDIGTITIKTLSKDLQSVTIQGEKPFIERQVDKTVVNIENSIVQAGSSILEVMEKLPGILVDQNGNVSLKGKQSVIIMIDGKTSALSGQDLVNMLRGMPSSNIQKIEIITNPSAKYDAAGSAGLINIVMKKNLLQGFTGNVSIGYGQGRYPKYNGSLSLNYKKSWYSLFLNYGYLQRNVFSNLVLTRKFYASDTLSTVFETDDYIRYSSDTHTPRLGADFYLSKKTTLSLVGASVLNKLIPFAQNHTDILDGNNNKVSSNDFVSDAKNNMYNYDFNAKLTHQIDTTGQELTLDINYAKYWNVDNQLFTTTSTNPSNSNIDKAYLVGKQNGSLYLYAAKADYAKPLKNKMHFDAGLKSSYVTSDKDMAFYNRVNSSDNFDTARSSHFLYSENINAGYLNFKKEFNKLSLQLGLRGEQTTANGKQVLDGQTFARNYFQLFPTLFVDYKFNEKHDINLSLGRRIDRPGYEQMNPFKRLIDATTYSEGNPYLLPQLTYNSELSYSFKSIFFVTASYSLTTDNITDVLIQDAQTRTTAQSIVNLNRFDYYSINLSLSKRLTKWWTTNTNLFSYYVDYSGTINNYQTHQASPSFFVTSNNSFSIKKGLSAECSFEYDHRYLYGITNMNSCYNLTLGIKKSILKKRGSLTLNVTDIFRKYFLSGVTQFGGVNETWASKRDTRVVNIKFSYKFGKGQDARMRKETGADDEKRESKPINI